MADIIYKKESYEIVGVCMDVYNELGKGFLEIVYKDAIAYEFTKKNIPFEREREYDIKYKDIILQHKYYADFVVYDKIILEVKAKSFIAEDHLTQSINYLAVSKIKLGIVVNFGEKSLSIKE